MAITAVVICAVGVFAHADFRTPTGTVEARAPFSFWILLLAIWGALNMVFVSRGSLHAVRRAGAGDLRRSAAGLPGRPRGDAAGCAAISALRARRLGPLPGRHGTALRRLRHARHRAAVAPGPRGARNDCRGRADDGGAACQDRALPAASLAAARPCRRAGRRQRGPLGAGGEGIVFHHRPSLVRRDAGRTGFRSRAASRWARRGARSYSAASSRCVRSD